MRLLVVSYAFPPFNSIGGVRVGKTVKYLLKLGHDVRVLTAQDQPFPQTLSLEVPPQNVIYTRSLNIRKPAQVALGEGAGSSAAENRQPRGGRIGATLKRSLGFPVRTLLYFPDANIGWLPFAVAAASRLFKEWKPDLMLASSPPPTSLLVAHRLSKRFHIPWVADMRDLWVEHQYYSQPGWRRVLEGKMERRVLSSAAGLVTVSEPLAETLKNKHGREAAVVRNGFDPADYPARGEVPFNGGEVRILYTGVVYEGKQDPSPLFSAMRELGDEAAKVRVKFYGSFLHNVRQLIIDYGVETLVEVHAPVPYQESLRMQCEADILLLLLWNDARHRGVYTGKLFEYIGARRPILAVGEAGDAASELIQSHGLGLVIREPGRIAEQLRLWIRQKEELGLIPHRPGKEVSGISREEQTKVLESYLMSLLVKDLR